MTTWRWPSITCARIGGGFVVVRDGKVLAELALPIAGLMSDQSFEEVRDALMPLRAAAKSLGTVLAEPFLQVAFLPLPVIPHLKITDRGLVDVDRFCLIEEALFRNSAKVLKSPLRPVALSGRHFGAGTDQLELQFVEVERLGQVAIKAGGQVFLAVAGDGIGGERHDSRAIRQPRPA